MESMGKNLAEKWNLEYRRGSHSCAQRIGRSAPSSLNMTQTGKRTIKHVSTEKCILPRQGSDNQFLEILEHTVARFAEAIIICCNKNDTIPSQKITDTFHLFLERIELRHPVPSFY